MPSLTSLKCGLSLKCVEIQPSYLHRCNTRKLAKKHLPYVYITSKYYLKHSQDDSIQDFDQCGVLDFDVFDALPSFFASRMETYNYPKMTILAIFAKKVRLKKLISGFKTGPKHSILQEKVSLTKGPHQKNFGASKSKNKNFISKNRYPSPKYGHIWGGGS